MTLAICVATMQVFTGESLPGYIGTLGSNAYVRSNTHTDNLGVVGSYQWLYERCNADVLAYVHDDVECYEAVWSQRVMEEFNDPKVGIVGFGGAKRHGHPDMYKTPYQLQQLARYGYLSNTKDADTHGTRFTGSTEVAVLDGFALCIRRSFLDKIGGWSQLIENGIDYLCYDYWACCLARRYGYTVRVVGISCHHYGGGTSVADKTDRQEEYNRSHQITYDHFRDVLPYEAK